MSFLTGLSDPGVVKLRYPSFRGKLAFDIGANAGVLANVLAANFETVVACEPHEASYAQLVEASASNVKPLNVAVSDRSGCVLLDIRSTSEGLGELFTGTPLPVWGEKIGQTATRSLTVDRLALTYGVPDFVKVDTEGHEVRVMRGAEWTFRHRPEFLIEIHTAGNGRMIREWLEGWFLPHELIRHTGYVEDSPEWENHYWLVSPLSHEQVKEGMRG